MKLHSSRVAGAVLVLYMCQPNWCRTRQCLAWPCWGEEKAPWLLPGSAKVSPGRQECHMGVRNISAAGNTLSRPSHTFNLFLVHLDPREVGFISVSSVPADLWYQHTLQQCPGAGGPGSTAEQPSSVLGSLLVLHPQPPAQPVAQLCCAMSA